MHADFCNCSLWEEPFCPGCYDSRWSDRSRPCPSAAFFHRSRAASRWGLRLGGGGGRFISPINILVSASLLYLGDLSTGAAGRVAHGRRPLLGAIGRRASPCPSRCF